MTETEHRLHPLLESWKVESPALRLRLPSLTAVADDMAAGLAVPEYGDRGRVKMLEVLGLDTVFCLEARAHVDDAHDRWFVLLALRASGQALHGRDVWPADFRTWRQEGHDPEQSITLERGDMAIVDGHRIHWLSGNAAFPVEAGWPGGEGQAQGGTQMQSHWFAAACYDAVQRPSRADAESMILERITPPS
jgi:hypothetical protein